MSPRADPVVRPQALGELEDGTLYYSPLGRLRSNRSASLVQCHLCGVWVKRLVGRHFLAHPGWAAERYRQVFELEAGLPLEAPEQRLLRTKPRGPYSAPIGSPRGPLGQLEDGTPYYARLARLAVSEDGRRVRCHLCGNWFQFLGGFHLVSRHGVSAEEYREMFGLNRTQGLASPRHQQRMRKSSLKVFATRSDIREALKKGQALAKSGALNELVTGLYAGEPQRPQRVGASREARRPASNDDAKSPSDAGGHGSRSLASRASTSTSRTGTSGPNMPSRT